MAWCVHEFPDGRVCRERGPVVDTRPVIGDDGKAQQVRIVACPVCGPRLQSIRDDGPAEKRYVPSQNGER